MPITIKNIPPIEKQCKHKFLYYDAFVDSDGDFFIINGIEQVIIMNEFFRIYEPDEEMIEDFLVKNFGTTLVCAYKKNEFNITIDLE
jgi:DNA-directed RNA polymerase beta subunit